MLPPHLERIREKLAENIHELWAVTRIEQGWTYGPVSMTSEVSDRSNRRHLTTQRLEDLELLSERILPNTSKKVHVGQGNPIPILK